MVAASPHDEIADTHWYRPDFDRALAQEAEAAGAVYLDMTRLDGTPPGGRRARRSKASATAPSVRDHRALRHRCERAARLPAPRARPCGSAAPLAPGDAGTLHALRRRRAMGPAAAAGGHAAVSDRRCRGASGVPRRMDLGAAFQQRHHQRRGGADRSDRGVARRRRGCAGVGPAAGDVAVGGGSVPLRARRRCPSSTRRGWRSAARASLDRRGRSCRPLPA